MKRKVNEATVQRIVTLRRGYYHFPWRLISKRTGLPVYLCRRIYFEWQAAAAKAEREAKERQREHVGTAPGRRRPDNDRR